MRRAHSAARRVQAGWGRWEQHLFCAECHVLYERGLTHGAQVAIGGEIVAIQTEKEWLHLDRAETALGKKLELCLTFVLLDTPAGPPPSVICLERVEWALRATEP